MGGCRNGIGSVGNSLKDRSIVGIEVFEEDSGKLIDGWEPGVEGTVLGCAKSTCKFGPIELRYEYRISATNRKDAMMKTISFVNNTPSHIAHIAN
jgi:hypothetical protein